MIHNFSVRIIRGSQSQKLIHVLGTDILPIDPPIPVPSSKGYAYQVDLKMLTRKQRRNLKNFLTSKQNLMVRIIQKFLPRHRLRIPTKDCVMPHVTQHQINLLRESFTQSMSKTSSGHFKKDAVLESYWISMMIITFFLGDEWLAKNMADNLFIDEKRMAYLRPRLETDKERYEHQFRFTLFADYLFLLQDCEGFDLKIKELQKITPENPEVKLEDIAIEFQIASMLVKSGHGVKFVRRSGIKRQDFDIAIAFKKTTSISAEIKCKRDDTPVSVSSLIATLYKAEEQLPINSPSLVFVRISTDWLKDANLMGEVDKAVQNFFQDASHVNAVVFVWEDWIEIQEGLKLSAIKFSINLHSLPKNALDNLNDLLLPTRAPLNIKGTFLEPSFGKFSD